MTTTEFSCGHQVNGSFTTERDDRNGGPIKPNYSMGKTKKPFICPQCEAKSKSPNAKDLPEKDKANQSNLTR